MRIIGKFGKRNNKKMSGDFCASATIVFAGTAVGINAPTVFLMEGKNRRSGFSDEHIFYSGCADMREKAFMA